MAADLMVDGRPLTWEWVRTTWPAADPVTFSPWGRAALAFCHAWLNDQSHFEVHTSGSTGPPQPVLLSREQMCASAQATATALGLQPGEPALVALPPASIAGRMMLVRGLELGLPLVVVEPTRRPLALAPPDIPLRFTALVPLQLEATLGVATEAARLDGMRAVLIGGAPLSPDLAQRVRQLQAPLYHTYGMTESATHVALRRLNGPDASDLFTPLPGVEVGQDERGCLTVCGPMTAGRHLTTHDHVTLLPDGRFRWLGRLDYVINSGGVKVQAEKVEAALQQLCPGRRVVVVGRPDPALGECVTALIEGSPLPVVALRAALGQTGRLSRYEMPRAFHFLPVFPETPTGKINRPALLAQLDAAVIPAARPD